MNIELEKGIVLQSDELQFTLRKEIGADKKGDKTYRTLGYYSDLDQALEGYLKHKTRTSEATTLQEILNEIKALKNHINNLAKELE